MDSVITKEVTVQSGGKIELVVPEAREGETVRVSVSLPEEKRQTLQEILERARGHRSHASAADVDAYLEELRDEWDR